MPQPGRAMERACKSETRRRNDKAGLGAHLLLERHLGLLDEVSAVVKLLVVAESLAFRGLGVHSLAQLSCELLEVGLHISKRDQRRQRVSAWRD